MFKGLGNIASMLRQAQQMGSRLKEINEQLRSRRVQGVAGGGMVEIEVNGVGEVLGVRIDPTLVERGEREMIEDLTAAALNQALARAKQLHGEAMQSMTEGLDLPGLGEALAEITGGKTEGD